MFDRLFASIRTRRDLERRIPIRYSTVPRGRAHPGVIVSLVLATMLLFAVDLSSAQTRADTPTAGPEAILAQSAPSGPQDGQGRPPREAIEACVQLLPEADCSFSGRGGQEVRGTCRSPETEAPAACVPVDMPLNG